MASQEEQWASRLRKNKRTSSRTSRLESLFHTPKGGVRKRKNSGTKESMKRQKKESPYAGNNTRSFENGVHKETKEPGEKTQHGNTQGKSSGNLDLENGATMKDSPLVKSNKGEDGINKRTQENGGRPKGNASRWGDKEWEQMSDSLGEEEKNEQQEGKEENTSEHTVGPSTDEEIEKQNRGDQEDTDASQEKKETQQNDTDTEEKTDEQKQGEQLAKEKQQDKKPQTERQKRRSAKRDAKEKKQNIINKIEQNIARTEKNIQKLEFHGFFWSLIFALALDIIGPIALILNLLLFFGTVVQFVANIFIGLPLWSLINTYKVQVAAMPRIHRKITTLTKGLGAMKMVPLIGTLPSTTLLVLGIQRAAKEEKNKLKKLIKQQKKTLKKEKKKKIQVPQPQDA